MHNLTIEDVQHRIDSVRTLSPLGRGGQKIVFSGFHDHFGKVAVKFVSESQPDERTKREIEISSTYSLPNTAEIYETGVLKLEEASYIYIVEEFIDGVTLRQELKNKGKLLTDTVLVLLGALLETTVAMEKYRIVHRDIKPENIMVCPDGSFKVLDFGIARHLAKTSITPTNAHFGPHTAGYAAPEQFRNLKKKIDIRTDLFAVGVVAYESLSGHNPFTAGARDHLDVLRRTEHHIPSSLVLPDDPSGELVEFIKVLISQYPSRRPPTAIFAKQWFDSIIKTLSP